MPRTQHTHYGFDNHSAHAADQMRYLADILDSTSRRHLGTLGDLTGRTCLDVGTGAGTVTAWLADEVGPQGHITATDLTPNHLRGLPANTTVLRHDIRSDELPDAPYDLIHARLVLMHLPERESVLKRLADALAPGGTLVLTEWQGTDNLVVYSPNTEFSDVVTRFNRLFQDHLSKNGCDQEWATRVLPAMRAAGLTNITAYVDAQTWAGGTAGCMLLRSNSFHLEFALREGGLSSADFVRLRTALEDPQFVLRGYLTHTAVGHAST